MKDKKAETSKLIIIFISCCFVVSLMYTLWVCTYSIINDKSCDFTLPIALLSSTGTCLCGAIAFYYSKAKIENVYKIKKSFLNEKYTILKNAGLLTEEYANQEIMDEVYAIDNRLDEAENDALVDTDQDININL